MKKRHPKYNVGDDVVRYPAGIAGRVIERAYFDGKWTYQLRLGGDWYYESELIRPDQVKERLQFPQETA